jgi:hypothetical protein
MAVPSARLSLEAWRANFSRRRDKNSQAYAMFFARSRRWVRNATLIFLRNFQTSATRMDGTRIAAGKKPLSWHLRGEKDRAKKQHAGNRYMSALCGRVVGNRQDRRAYRDNIRVGHTGMALSQMRIHGKGNALFGGWRGRCMAAL